MFRLRIVISLAAVLLLSALPAAAAEGVKAWEEDTVIPTYLAGPPEPNPMFYLGRAYQGAQGRVYPYPLYDTLTGKKVDKTYKMVYLENEYIRIGILPEIGGRIFSALDKTNNYHFFYTQHVVKPALIGMIGAWISGGVEWNIPHHHRASSFLPVQYRIEESPDGSRTVWVGELELRHRMRWAVGYTLHPGTSYLQTSIRILNRTPVVNTILCFANVAVHANENYQVIFPPRTQYVTQHSKREFTTWPVATTFYGGADFRRGADVSWYKNHTLATSMFAWNYEDDFVAGYDHGKQAGTLSVSDHHVVPGKKFFTWGNGPAGRVWDKALTDDDGPYLELMVGAYSDNQPDYSWIQPYEVKSLEEFWYPFRDIGGVKNANLDAAVNLETAGGAVKLGFYTTSRRSGAQVLLQAGSRVLVQETVDIGPDKPYAKQVPLPAGIKEEDLRASLSASGRELVSYSPVRPKAEPMPKTVQPPPPPAEIKSVEELYLAGQRIEQFHNPALDPEPYWEEALRRDPGDSRVNTALGIRCLKKALYPQAEERFRAALARLTASYTSPKDGEAYYYLGLALEAQGKTGEAYDAFYHAIWSAAWQPAGYYSLAELACRRGDLRAALDFVNRSLAGSALNTRALNLKAALVRRTGRADEAVAAASAARNSDPLDVRALTELWLAVRQPQTRRELLATLRDHPATGLETAVEYGNAGLWQDGVAVLSEMLEAAPDRTRVSPLVYYYLGYFTENLGDKTSALEYYRLAAKMPPDYVFPFQSEAIAALRHAMAANPADGRAPYYLGNLLFDWQPAEAVKAWEESRARDASFPIVYRNLALAYARQQDGLNRAIESLEKAVALGGNYAIHLFELDQLYERAGAPPEKRLAALEQHHQTVLQRDDALSREIALKVFAGKCDDAIALLKDRHFNVWEGGARFSVHDYWTDAYLLRGRKNFAARRFAEALADYRTALEFPPNLETARTRSGGRSAEVAYWVGTAYEALGDRDKAVQSWKESSAQLARADGIQRYYRALSLRKLGQQKEADAIFQDLLKSGPSSDTDVFAKFGERQSERIRISAAHFTAGLGYLGLDDKAKARQEFTRALQASPDHLGAKTALAGLD